MVPEAPEVPEDMAGSDRRAGTRGKRGKKDCAAYVSPPLCSLYGESHKQVKGAITMAHNENYSL